MPTGRDPTHGNEDGPNNSNNLISTAAHANFQQPMVSSQSSSLSEKSDLNVELVNGVLNHFESLRVNMKLPTYAGEDGNPMEFLDKLEKYFRR